MAPKKARTEPGQEPLPVLDTTGRPDPKYFKLWKAINENLEPGERLPDKAGRPKPEVVYREAEGALQQIASQWKERFEQMQAATPGQERAPPVLILVCDNTDMAEVFYRKISGETEVETVSEAEVAEVLGEEDEGNGNENGNGAPKKAKAGKRKTRTVFGKGVIFPELFSNTPDMKRTIRIDTKLLAEAESDDPKKKKQDAAEELRQVVATVGKPGQPGEHVRCVVSVSMLTEGWDANNVTHILGIRAFGSQLLCEQVVGRGLRRMDYVPDPETGVLTEEYVDVYGIPFSVIPFKGRPVKAPAPDDSEGEAPLLPITNRYKPIGTTAEVDFKSTRPCHATVKSHIDQVVLDNLVWEASAAFRLEASSAVSFYARNDHMGLTIPYNYMGIDHAYEPDFLVRLVYGMTVALEIKGFEDDQTRAKHNTAKRWVEAVNNWGQLGAWGFHVCRNPQILEKELEYLLREVAAG